VQGLVAVAVLGSTVTSGTQARFNEANASGEIPCGRKIDFLGSVDDGSSTETDLAATRQIIDEDKAFAIVPTYTPFLQSASTYINEKQVPTIGWGVSPGFCPTSNFSSTYLFGFTGCAAAADPGYVSDTSEIYDKLFSAQGQGSAQGKTIALIANNQATAQAGLTSEGREFTAAGMKIVYSQAPVPAPPSVVTDYSPYVQALMTSASGKPPSMISLLLNAPNGFPLTKALRQAGYKGLILQGSGYSTQLTAAAATTFYGNQWATVEAPTPAMTAIISTLNKGGVTAIGQPELAGYFAADMFVDVLKKVGADLTPQRFQQVASTFTYSIPTVVGPTVFPAGFLTSPSCSEIVGSDGTKWSVAVPYTCFNQSLKKEGSNWVPVPYPGGVTLPGQ
jgi:ABC-type branched-subunit amino acid transport system substrate-binding protein